MAELKTVIQALEYGFERHVCADRIFRYGDMPQPYNVTHLMGDAAAHLKALVPRVLELEEIHPRMTFWLEDIDKDEVIPAIGGSFASGVICFIDVYDRSIAALESEYNIRWRAWTLKPTQEEREVEPWNSRP